MWDRLLSMCNFSRLGHVALNAATTRNNDFSRSSRGTALSRVSLSRSLAASRLDSLCSEENYIDLDRMLVEKAGKFRLESYGMLDGAGDGPMMASRIHKYDFSDPMVIEVKSPVVIDALAPV